MRGELPEVPTDATGLELIFFDFLGLTAIFKLDKHFVLPPYYGGFFYKYSLHVINTFLKDILPIASYAIQ